MTGLPTPARYLSEISNHVQNHFGSTSFVLHEEKSVTVHVDVHVVPPNADRPYFTLLTSGMSDLNMHVPEGLEEFELAEACLCLPSYWPLAIDTFEWREAKYFWPIKILHQTARYPHRQNTWLCWGHTVGGVEVPQPIDEQVEFTGVLFVAPQTFPDGASQVKTIDGRGINYLAAIPLLHREMLFARHEGSEELVERLFEAGVNELLQPDRQSVV